MKSSTGFCKVDETPKGWYIQYIDRDPETIRRQEEQARKKKQELDDEERSARMIEEQVRKGREGKGTDVSTNRADPSLVLDLLVQLFIIKVVLFYRKLQSTQSSNGRVRKKKVCVFSYFLNTFARKFFFPLTLTYFCLAVAFNLGACSSVAGPSKSRYRGLCVRYINVKYFSL